MAFNQKQILIDKKGYDVMIILFAIRYKYEQIVRQDSRVHNIRAPYLKSSLFGNNHWYPKLSRDW